MGKTLKYSWPIPFAMLIDGAQFFLTLGVSVIATFPATTGGGFLGCIVGKHFIGEIGCAAGGFILAVIGTPLNAVAAPFTIPIGVALGLAITICISATFGLGLMLIMGLTGTFRLTPAFWLISEITPGVSVVPVWTIFAARCAYLNIKDTAGLAPANVFGKFAFAGISQYSNKMRGEAELMTPQGIEESQPARGILNRFTPYNQQERGDAVEQEKDLAAQYRPHLQTRSILNDVRQRSTRNNTERPYVQTV